MDKKPTPGPWRVGKNNGWNPNIIYGDGGLTAVASVYLIPLHSRIDKVGDCGGMPDAHLIAAAPDLLEALEKALDDHESSYGVPADHWTLDAQDALAKARGET